ncbi:MAG: hypothetical protein ACTIOG_07610, partial [Pseudomonas helleri]
MADQTQQLEIATVNAEIGSNIVYRFANDPVDADQIPTDSGEIQNLKQLAGGIAQDGKDAVAQAVAEGVVDLTEAVESASSSAAQAVSARDAAKISAGIKDDVAQGLATTSLGEYFSVPSPDATEYLILYQNNAGAALEVRRYPSSKKVEDLEAGEFSEVGLKMTALAKETGYAWALVDSAGRAALLVRL